MDLEEEKKVKKAALLLLARRAYLSAELRKKLLTKGFSPEAIERVILFCEEKGYLSDTQRISRLIEKEQKRGLSKMMIYAKLKQKGIDAQQLKKALDEAPLSEQESLEKWLTKHAKKVKTDDPVALRKLVASLVRRGFSQGLIASLLSRGRVEFL